MMMTVYIYTMVWLMGAASAVVLVRCAGLKRAANMCFTIGLLSLLVCACGNAFAQDADGGSPDSVSPDGPDSTVTVSDYGG